MFELIMLEDIPKELAGFKQLESFGLGVSLATAAHKPVNYIVPITTSWIVHCPTLRELSIFLADWDEPEGRYKILGGKAEPTSEPCRIEKVFTHTNGLVVI
ncbi:hypothetical protein C8J56DRAFT_888643 [Mycena floridula]|nr:hypothetical protein C8J56DRAFT_888643 [Mycena floridula]